MERDIGRLSGQRFDVAVVGGGIHGAWIALRAPADGVFSAKTEEAAAEMRQWDHAGGFSLHAAVRVEATDRKGLVYRFTESYLYNQFSAMLTAWLENRLVPNWC